MRFRKISPVQIIYLGVAANTEARQVSSPVITLVPITVVHVHPVLVFWFGDLQITLFTGKRSRLPEGGADLCPVYQVAIRSNFRRPRSI